MKDLMIRYCCLKKIKILYRIIKIGYSDIFKWQQSQNDPNYQYQIVSEDNDTVWMGKGLGGGTLHFGLQYIDNEELINSAFSNNSTIKDDVAIINNVVNATRYNYSYSASAGYSPNQKYYELKDYIDTNGNNQLTCHNNKVYSTNVEEGTQRLLLGDLINNNPNITIQYDTQIDKINFKSNNSQLIDSVIDFDGNIYTAVNYILCAGAIQTPAILQRSGIDCGNQLYDHGGITILYGKLEAYQEETEVSYSGDENFILNDDNIEKINTYSSRYIYSVDGANIPVSDKNKIYDFTSWVNFHPGGSSKITKWSNSVYKYKLIYPSSHSSSRWNTYKSLFDVLPDNFLYNGTINYQELPNNLKSDSLYSSLFPSQTITETKYRLASDLGFSPNTIIPHIQTRHDTLNWQTYYSTVPSRNDILIITHAQSNNLSGEGSVKINTNTTVTPELRVNVELNHLKENTEAIDAENNSYIDDIYQAYQANHTMLTAQGYQLISPQIEITKEYIKNSAGSIYHYHGSVPIDNVLVDNNQKIIGKQNLYIGDISVLNRPWGGSTSFPLWLQVTRQLNQLFLPIIHHCHKQQIRKYYAYTEVVEIALHLEINSVC